MDDPHEELNRRLRHAVTAGDAELTGKLIAEGADKDAKIAGDFTLLHVAAGRQRECSAHCNHTSVIEVLLQAGADTEATNKSRLTPLHVAAATGHTPVVEALIRAGAVIDPRGDDGMTPLLWAII